MIQTQLETIKQNIPDHVTVVAVSKTKPNEDILSAYETGHRIFGENKVQELTEKYEALPKDIQWHLIGHLQSNKVKYIAPFVTLIHSLDSLKLAKEINKRALQNNRTIDCLLQIHIANEDSKFGLKPEEIESFLSSESYKNLNNIRITGLMGMATNTDNAAVIKNEFESLNSLFNKLKQNATEFGLSPASFNTLSMGMSNDYTIAIEAGSNMVRLGSTIFGTRNYTQK